MDLFLKESEIVPGPGNNIRALELGDFLVTDYYSAFLSRFSTIIRHPRLAEGMLNKRCVMQDLFRVHTLRVHPDITYYLGTASLHIKMEDRITNRWWQYLDRQDIFWKISLWPVWAQTDILLPHKNDSEMYNLFFFLNANGLLPGLCKQWIMGMDYDWATKRQIDGVYSPKEILDMNKVMVKAYQGTLLEGKKQVYDMLLRRPVNM